MCATSAVTLFHLRPYTRYSRNVAGVVCAEYSMPYVQSVLYAVHVMYFSAKLVAEILTPQFQLISRRPPKSDIFVPNMFLFVLLFILLDKTIYVLVLFFPTFANSHLPKEVIH